MDFRVYVIVEAPILDKSYEMLVPIDRKIHEIIGAIKKIDQALSKNYYENHTPNLFNVSSGEIYDMNTVVENTNIKMGTRLLLI